jgi:hypothetical protein
MRRIQERSCCSYSKLIDIHIASNFENTTWWRGCFSQPSPIIIELVNEYVSLCPSRSLWKYRNCAPKHIQAISDHFELIRDPGDRDTVRTLVESMTTPMAQMPPCFQATRVHVRHGLMQDAGAFLIKPRECCPSSWLDGSAEANKSSIVRPRSICR